MLIMASGKGDLDMVNRLLDCKEIDVNLTAEDEVSGMFDFIPSVSDSLIYFFLDMFFN